MWFPGHNGGQAMKLYGTITKAEENGDGTLTVLGVCSTESKDSQGDIIPAETMKAAIPDYMKFGAVREMHRTDTAAGTALNVEVKEDGKTYIEALVVDPVSVKKVQTGVLKGFSIGGGIPKDGGRDAKNRRIVKKLHLTEISLVDRPANPEAVITLFKSDTTAEEADMADTTQNPAPGAEGEGTTEEQPVRKSLWDVKGFAQLLLDLGYLAQSSAAEATYEGDNSPVPAKLKEWLAAGCVLFQEMAMEEQAELLASIKTGPEVLLAAAKAAGALPEDEEPLEKKGAKYSKATKAAILGLRKAMQEASECMKAFDDAAAEQEADEGGEDTEKVAKAALVETEEKLSKVQAERDELQEKLAKAEGDLATTKADLEALDTEAKKLLAKFQTKGALKVVAVEKSADTTPAGTEPLTKSAGGAGKEAEPVSTVETIKKIHAAGGVPVLNRTR